MKKQMSHNYYWMVFLIIIGFCNSCATRYHSLGVFTTGYNNIRFAKDGFTVTFRANKYTTREDVRKFALRRASELALENGFMYFQIISEKDISDKVHVTTSSTMKSVVSPGIELVIQCSVDKRELSSINAKEFLHYNS
ncbi:MAG: CC0125/CC1285 family lipoprotein [Chlamydiales bacterium]